MISVTPAGSQPILGSGLVQRLGKHPLAALSVLLAICIALFAAAIPLPRADGQLVGSDGAFYYAYLPSLILDHDLDFSNQYSVLLTPEVAAQQHRTPDGRAHNKYAIGAALLWAPFFLIGHLAAIGLRSSGYSIALDGMGYVYQIPTLLGSILYAFAGLFLVYRCCRKFFGAAPSLLSAILLLLATNLVYYTIAEPSMSHGCSFFAAALFLTLWLSFRPDPTFGQWAILGLSGGLIALIRQPDAAWLLLPALDILRIFRANGKRCLPRLTKGILIYGISAAVVFIPQILVWQSLNGTPVLSGYAYTGEHFRWFSPRIWKLFFSLNHGLFSWHPVLLAAAIGFIPFYRKEKSEARALLLISGLQAYIIAAWYGWSGGDSFGSRMLIDLLPVLAFGLAASIEWMLGKRRQATLVSLALAFVLWNGLFFLQYRFGYISKLRPITLREMTIGKITMLADLPVRLRGMLR